MPLTLIAESLTPKNPLLVTNPIDAMTYAGSAAAIPFEGLVYSCILGDVFLFESDVDLESSATQFFTSGSSSYVR
jgi:hypothetical protein